MDWRHKAACRQEEPELFFAGVWGGLNEDERRSLKRKRARQRAKMA
jgi:hypothetical protein